VIYGGERLSSDLVGDVVEKNRDQDQVTGEKVKS
jgi:hypothetical protein